MVWDSVTDLWNGAHGGLINVPNDMTVSEWQWVIGCTCRCMTVSVSDRMWQNVLVHPWHSIWSHTPAVAIDKDTQMQFFEKTRSQIERVCCLAWMCWFFGFSERFVFTFEFHSNRSNVEFSMDTNRNLWRIPWSHWGLVDGADLFVPLNWHEFERRKPVSIQHQSAVFAVDIENTNQTQQLHSVSGDIGVDSLLPLSSFSSCAHSLVFLFHQSLSWFSFVSKK